MTKENKLPTKQDGSPFSFFIIDDSLPFLMTMKKIVDGYGGNVIGGSVKGNEALEMIEKNKDQIDFVTLDILMPDVSGIDLIPKIKAINDRIQIIMVTAVRRKESLRESLELGAKHFIIKPFKSEQVLTILSKMCNVNPQQQQTLQIIINEHKQLNIFLVEDSKLIANFLKAKFECVGCNIEGIANSGSEALDKIEKHQDKIDIIVLSMVLPDMEGMTLILKLAMMNPEIKIIVFSAKDNKETVDSALNSGAHYFISKNSFEDKRFYEILQEIVLK